MSNDGEHTVKLKELDTSEIENDPGKMNTLEARLKNLDELTDPRMDTATQTKPAVSDNDIKDDDIKDDVKDPDSTPVDDGGDKDDNEDNQDTIPDAFIRSAVHSGWTEEKIREDYEANPEATLRLLENIHISSNNLTKHWSALGRNQANNLRQPEPRQPEPNQAQNTGELDATIVKLRKDYNNDPIIDGVVVPLTEALKKVTAGFDELKQQQHTIQQSDRYNDRNADSATEQQLNVFFNADNMAEFNEFYGSLKPGQSWDHLTAVQRQNRYAVIEEATAALVGADSVGQRLSEAEALDKAHLVITEPIRVQTIRDSIKSQAVKRKKSMVIRPSDGKRSQDSINKADGNSKPSTRKELESRVAANLNKVFSR